MNEVLKDVRTPSCISFICLTLSTFKIRSFIIDVCNVIYCIKSKKLSSLVCEAKDKNDTFMIP